MDETIWKTSGVATVIEGEDLEEHAEVLDALRLGGNVGVKGYGGGGSGEVSLRGYGENSGLRVLVLVDGQKVNGPDMGGIDWQEIPLGEVAFVEVLRGGQTVVHGQHAMGGVVRIETHGAKEGGAIRLGAGGDGYLMGEIRGGVGVGGVVFGGGVQRMKRDGYREKASSWGESVQGSLRFRTHAGVESLWRGHVGRGAQSYPGPLSYAEALANPRSSQLEGYQGSRGDYSRQSVRFRGSEGWGDWEVQGGWREDQQEISLDGQFAHRAYEGWRGGVRAKVGGSARYLLLGVETVGDRLGVETYVDERYQYRLSEADLGRLTMGGYVFGQMEMGRRTVVSAGSRYETVSTDFQHRVYDPKQVNPLDPVIWDPFRANPLFKEEPDIVAEGSFDEVLRRSGVAFEASLVRLLDPFGRIWVGWDKPYRYPVLDEMASYQGYRLSQPLNRDLRAEEGNQVEIGWDWVLSGGRVSAAVFESRVKDEIIFDETVGLNVNIGKTRRVGAELAVEMKIERWRWSLQWDHVQARLESGEASGRRIPLVAEDRVSLIVDVQLTERIKVGMDVQYESARFQGNDYANTRQVLESTQLFGVKARFDVSSDASILVRLFNVLDAAYISTAFNGSYYPGSGRRWEVLWTWKP